MLIDDDQNKKTISMGVITIEKIDQSICANCIHRTYCSLRNGSLIWDCSEYDPGPPIKMKHRAKQPELTSRANTVQGLCATCDLRHHCQWRKKDQVIFHCEHYT